MPNRLKDETSPYLLQHADNPVDWYPWGEEAFMRAKSEGKPIFLSIGYAACHWCHVMAHESFEDPEIAEIMNRHFVSIKVDREERPDVDSIYMDAIVALTGQGGWPLSAFLTPEGEPFYGGTYFPPTRRFNMPSFQEVLESVHEQWSTNREQVDRIGKELSAHIRSTPVFEAGEERLEPAALDSAAEQLFEKYDWKNGGWGGAPKFPQASAVEFLLQRYHRKRDRLALDMAKHALQSMARGGIFDQVGGGFHRYAVDERWLIPHFEKMLYDNAVLLPAYLHVWQLTGEPEFLEVVDKTIQFLIREMQDDAGGFFASLDADSEGEEGKFYVWTADELRTILTDEADRELALDVYGLRAGPNFEGANVLYLPDPVTDIAHERDIDEQDLRKRLRRIEAQLLNGRASRPRPAADDKIITAWNGLLLIALAEAARALKNADYLSAAQKLAGFLSSELKTQAGWRRTWRKGVPKNAATLRDLAGAGLGFLALYETDFNPVWFQEAEELCVEILEHYQDPQGGFYDTRDDLQDLIARPKSIQDTPLPSGNSLAVMLFLKMYNFTSNGQYAEPAERALRGMQSMASRHPTAFAGWLSALDYAIGPGLQLALLGDPDQDQFKRFKEAVDTRFLPLLIRAGGKPGEQGHPELLDNRSAVGGEPTAYLCKGFICNKPTNAIDDFLEQLETALHS
ncbi:MAG: thioredoxin domain-containing protein [Anaerolineales bacterium]|nr:thioredoxin domain-containing protein [Anaerolineales bacterium]